MTGVLAVIYLGLYFKFYLFLEVSSPFEITGKSKHFNYRLAFVCHAL